MSANAIARAIEGVNKLFNNVNKVDSSDKFLDEGVKTPNEELGVFSIQKNDEDLIKIAENYEKSWKSYYDAKKETFDKNMSYYLGVKYGSNKERISQNSAGNLIFEAVETLIPASLGKNPEPLVFPSTNKKGDLAMYLASDIKTMLQYHTKIKKLRKILFKLVRGWAIYQIGCLKHGWDEDLDDISTTLINPENLILDPDSWIDEKCEYTGYVIGEKVSIRAEEFISKYDVPQKVVDEIKSETKNQLSNKIIFTEWTTDDFVFIKYKKNIIDKYPNPNFIQIEDQVKLNEAGIDVKNHFKKPKKNYTFLSVFSLGKQPFDETGLIEQNRPNQDIINSRITQIDYNVTRSNNAIVFGGNLNQEQADKASAALTKGHNIYLPGDDVNKNIKYLPAQSIPDSHFNFLETVKRDSRSSFGITGISPTELKKDIPVRGQILNQSFDTGRINGSIGEAIEGVVENVFNWWYQMYKVFYTEEKYASFYGDQEVNKFVSLSRTKLNEDMVISIAPNSLLPKDEVSLANQTMELYKLQAIDLETLYQKLNFPDPHKLAGEVWLSKLDPLTFIKLKYPDIAQQIQQSQIENAQLQQQTTTAQDIQQGGSPKEQPIPSPGTSIGNDADPFSNTTSEEDVSREETPANFSGVSLPPI